VRIGSSACRAGESASATTGDDSLTPISISTWLLRAASQRAASRISRA
jgi:hypothetical protein